MYEQPAQNLLLQTKYCQMLFWGNLIAEYNQRHPDWDKLDSIDAYKDFYTNDKDFYKNESIKTFVWLPIKTVDENYMIEEPTARDLEILMAISLTGLIGIIMNLT